MLHDEIDRGFSWPLRSALNRVLLHEIRERCTCDNHRKCVSEILERVIGREDWAQLQTIKICVKGTAIYANYNHVKKGPASFEALYEGLAQEYAVVMDLIRKNAAEIASLPDKAFMDCIDRLPDEAAPSEIVEGIVKGSVMTIVDSYVIYDADRKEMIAYGKAKGYL